MKYSLRSLMIVVLVAPPLLAWGGVPIYRWLTTPNPPSALSITPPSSPPGKQLNALELVILERRLGELERDVRRGPRTTTIPIEDRDKEFQRIVEMTDLPNSQAPAPNQRKP